MKLQRCIRLRIIAFAAVVVFFFPLGAATQDVGSKDSALRVFTTRSIATVLEKVGTHFERRTGRRLSVTTDVAVRMVRRINAGEQFDFLVAAPAQIDELIKAGKIIPETRTDSPAPAALMERTGDRTRADALLRTLGTGEAYGASTGIAIFHAMRGDAEQSAEWAARGIAQRYLPLVYMLAPLLKSQRQWPALARLLNLPASGAIASA